MRKKKWLILTAVMLIMALLCLALVACVDPTPEPDPDPDPDPDEITGTEVLDLIFENFGKSYNVGDAKYFGVDVLADAALATTGEAGGQLWKYELLVKANINLKEGATDDETSFRVELNSYINADQKTTLFGLLYENEMNESDGTLKGSYIYVTVLGEVYKTEAFSLLEVVNKLTGASIAADENGGIVSILSAVIGMLVTDGYIADNGDAVIEFNLQEIWSNLMPIVKPLIEDPEELADLIGDPALGETIIKLFSALDGIIADNFGNLTYDKVVEDDPATEEDESGVIQLPVNSVNTMIEYIEQNLPYVVAKAAFKFNDKGVFQNMNVTADYQAHNDEGKYDANSHKFTANVHKAIVGDKTGVQVDEGFPLSKEERFAMTEVMNIVNFKISGSVEFSKASSKDVLNWTLNADINPFALLDGITLESIKNLGYLNLTVYNAATDTYMLTIDCKFANGYAIIAYRGFDNRFTLSNVGIGGKYDFASLMDAITILGGGKVNVDSKAAAVAEGESDVLSTIISMLLNSLDLSDLTNNGLVLNNVDKTVETLMDILLDGVDLGPGISSGMVATIVKGLVFNSKTELAVKVSDIEYGKAVKHENDELGLSILREGDVLGVINGKPAAGQIRTQYEYGENGLDVTYSNTSGNNRKTFVIHGTNVLTGQMTEMNAVYMGSTYDSTVVGKQIVRVYYGTNTIFNNVGGLSGGAIKDLLANNPMIPAFGIDSFEIEVNTYDKISQETVYVDVQGTQQMVVGDNVADMLNGYLIYANGRKVKITDSMISCDKPILNSDKNLISDGIFDIKVKHFTAETTVKIVVGGLSMNYIDDIVIGQDDLVDILELKIKTYDSNGFVVLEKYEPKITAIDCNGIKDIDKVFINDSYVIDGNLSFIDKTISVTFEYEIYGLTKTKTVKLTMKADSPKITTKEYNFAANAPITSLFQFYESKIGGGFIYYYSTYKNGSWKMMDPEEKLTYDIDMDVEFYSIDDKGNIATEKTLLKADGTMEKAGKYLAKYIDSKGHYLTREITVKEAIVISDKKGQSGDIALLGSSGIFTVNLVANGMVEDALVDSSKKSTPISISYKNVAEKGEADDYQWIITYKDVKGETKTVTGKIKFTYSIDGVEKDITTTETSNDGKFKFDDAYKGKTVTIKMVIEYNDSTTYENSATIAYKA